MLSESLKLPHGSFFIIRPCNAQLYMLECARNLCNLEVFDMETNAIDATCRPPLIFVAGPYFAKDHETISRNITEANAEGQALFDAGCLALVVHNHTHH